MLRRRRRRSQFATAAAAALQAAVSRAAAAAARPRFNASPRRVAATHRSVGSYNGKPEQELGLLHGERVDDTSHIDLQATMCDRRADHGRQPTANSPGLRYTTLLQH